MNIALFISGSGSLLGSFAREASRNENFNIVTVVADRKCNGIEKAHDLGFEVAINENFDQNLIEYLKEKQVDIICLAGFLKILPADFIEAFDGRILNTHPSLLPKFGGTYGDKVHAAVLKAGEKESGFTIHEVTPELDEGPIIFQKKCPVYEGDTAKDLRERVRVLEKEWYPKVSYDFASASE